MFDEYFGPARKAIANSHIGVSSSKILAKWFSVEEFHKLSQLASPLILASLVTMSISITDVIMIGKLGTVELAAGAAASDYYSIFFYLAAGVIAAISPMIAQARGKQQFRNIKSITLLGLLAGILTGIPASIAIYHAPQILALIGVEQQIVQVAAPYSRMMAVAIFPMLSVMAMHHFLSAHGKTIVILFVTVIALPVNALGNYGLLYGYLGLPKMGLAGAGIATVVTGSFMFLSMLVYVLKQSHLKKYFYFPFYSDYFGNQLKEVFGVGLPIGISHVGEMGVFLFSTVTMGIFGAEVLAAHTIALRAAGVFYAVPMGYAQAATIRLGYLVGRSNTQDIRNALNTVVNSSLVFGTLLMLFIIVVKNSLPELVLQPGKFTNVVMIEASAFITLLALMQPGISLGTIGAGALRGFKDTKVPMLFSIGSYWGLGFIGAMVMAFWIGLNGTGIWVGLLLATFMFAATVVIRLRKRYC